jgi:hypothetical protein
MDHWLSMRGNRPLKKLYQMKQYNTHGHNNEYTAYWHGLPALSH